LSLISAQSIGQRKYPGTRTAGCFAAELPKRNCRPFSSRKTKSCESWRPGCCSNVTRLRSPGVRPKIEPAKPKIKITVIIPSEVEESRSLTRDNASGCLDFARHDKNVFIARSAFGDAAGWPFPTG